jgi:hypothetical protein
MDLKNQRLNKLLHGANGLSQLHTYKLIREVFTGVAGKFQQREPQRFLSEKTPSSVSQSLKPKTFDAEKIVKGCPIVSNTIVYEIMRW